MRRLLIAIALLSSVAACKPYVPTGPSAGEQLVQNATASGLPTIAEFGAETCASCRQMKGVLDSVASRTEGRAHVLIVDISKDFRAAKTYNIQMMPTQVFFDTQGKEVWRHMGPLTEGQVLERLGLGQ